MIDDQLKVKSLIAICYILIRSVWMIFRSFGFFFGQTKLTRVNNVRRLLKKKFKLLHLIVNHGENIIIK